MNKTRESVAYSKDFMTGDVISKPKHKSDIGIKGKVTLSLFDAQTKVKLKESYTENLIPDLYFKDVFLTQFLNGIMGVGDSRTGKNYSWFNYLYLTDSDKPESKDEQCVMGNIIGYAHRNTAYSGSDPLQGTINHAETKFEVSGNKIRCNFVFDFPTHAANGIIESVYFCESPPVSKDYFYMGAPIFGRELGDNGNYIYASQNPRRFYGIHYGFNSSTTARFTSPTKGYFLIDGKSGTFTQSPYLQFPENLKGHMIYMPFDVSVNDCMLWEQAVRLLNADGDPLAIQSSDPDKKNDGLHFVCPHKEGENDVLIGYYLYSVYVGSSKYHYYLRIYKWSKVGVLQSKVDVNITTALADEYGSDFTYAEVRGDNLFLDGTLDVVGYNQRMDDFTKENIYTSRWARISTDGAVVQNMEIKPKIGNCTWFATKGMDSANIERRCYVNGIRRGKSRVYLSYAATQGGTAFWQCLTTGGNLIEPRRQNFAVSDSYYSPHNILGTDRYIGRFSEARSDYSRFMFVNALTSRPIGTHTRLAQPVEKTEANTMKVQYLFEVDLPIYGEDYY